MGGRPGEVLPPFVQDQLQLTDAQRLQIEALQQEVNAQLAKILSQEQQQMLMQGPPGGGLSRSGSPPGQQPPQNLGQGENQRQGNRPPAEE